MPDRILIIGIGNEYRGDDAAGLLVSRRLKARNLPQTQIVEESGEGAALIDTWETSHAQLVILIDAVASGKEPGTVYRLDASSQTIPSEFFNYSTHAFSVAEAVELARVLDKLPPHTVIYGIEGKQYGAGSDLSSAVAEAIPEAADRIVQEIQANLDNSTD